MTTTIPQQITCANCGNIHPKEITCEQAARAGLVKTVTIAKQIKPREIAKAVIASRGEMRRGLEAVETAQITKDAKKRGEWTTAAYSHFERAERYTFQAKDLVRNGGDFEQEEDDG